jgi:hypothetical protein
MKSTEMMLFVALGLFFGMLVATEVGRRIGARRLAEEPESAGASSGLVDGAIFGLMGLLIAFTFSGAASRFDHRRDLVMDEANAIGTAYLRLDLLPTEMQPALRGLFRQYLDTRLDAYRKLPDIEASEAALAQANGLQGRIWLTAVKACQALGSAATTTLLLSALNQMFDIAAVRTATARVMHPPTVIFAMLFGLALLSSALAGYAMTGKSWYSWLHVLAFATMTSITVYVILDVEYPRFGLIRVGLVDQVLVDVRNSMDQAGESQTSRRKD